MASSKLRNAIGLVKDQASIGMAKVASNATVSDLEVAIVKATSHEDCPSDSRHIHDILNLTAYSRSFMSCCIGTISTRLNKTRNWVVAIKVLVLLHRLRANGDPAYEQEIFLAVRRGTRLFNLSDFRDDSGRTNSSHYSAFVRAYAAYMDAHLEFRMQGQMKKRTAPLKEMKNDAVFAKVQHLLLLLERFLACLPTGAAKDSKLVQAALFRIVVESFQLYRDTKRILEELTDRFRELESSDMVRTHEIFSQSIKVLEDLDAFYGWCRTVEVVCNSEYPDVEKISQEKLDTMDEFIREKSTISEPSLESKLETEIESQQQLDSSKAEETKTEEENKATRYALQEAQDLLNEQGDEQGQGDNEDQTQTTQKSTTQSSVLTQTADGEVVIKTEPLVHQ